MSLLQDPFYVVKEEVQQSVSGITTLYDRWQELQKNSNTAQNDEYKWTVNQLKTGIKSIEWDLQDLEETIGIVEGNRQRFKLEQAEVESRKKFIQETKSVIKKMKDDLNSASSKGRETNDQRQALMQTKTPKGDPNDRYAGLNGVIQQDNDRMIGDQQGQQMQIMRQQDQELDAISNTIGQLGAMGEAIHTELSSQSRMLDEMNDRVDQTDSRLTNVMRKVNHLLESTSDRVQWCLIIVLTLMLIGLVIIVFYV